MYMMYLVYVLFIPQISVTMFDMIYCMHIRLHLTCTCVESFVGGHFQRL